MPSGEKFPPGNQIILQIIWKLYLPLHIWDSFTSKPIDREEEIIALAGGVVNSSHQKKFGYCSTKAVRNTILRTEGIY